MPKRKKRKGQDAHPVDPGTSKKACLPESSECLNSQKDCNDGSAPKEDCVKKLKPKKKAKSSKKTKKNKKQKLNMPSSNQSSSSSSKVSQDDTLPSKAAAPSSETGGSGPKSQCDLCKLSYSSEKELTEHFMSLMHHTKLDQKDKHAVHECPICNKTFPSMTDYRTHIGSDKHKRSLDRLQNKHSHQNKFHKRNKQFQGKNLQNFTRSPYNGPYNNYRPDSHNKFDEYYGMTYGNRTNSNNERDYQDFAYRQKKWNRNPNFGNLSKPWGSGAYGTYSFDQRRHYDWRTDNQEDFTNDNWNYEWDDQSLTRHEEMLADMDNDYLHKQRGRQDPSGNSKPKHVRFVSKKFQEEEGRVGANSIDLPSRERKRPLIEDSRNDSHASSSSSPFKHPACGSTSAAVDNSSSGRSEKHSKERRDNYDNLILLTNGNKSVQENSFFSTIPSTILLDTELSKGKNVVKSAKEKSQINETSDNILERAEKLCKELKEKREATFAQNASMLKLQKKKLINEKMQDLMKKQQSYLKGHADRNELAKSNASVTENSKSKHTPTSSSSITNVTPEFMAKNRISTTTMQSEKRGEKSLEEIRKSIEQSVLEEGRRHASTVKSKIGSVAQTGKDQRREGNGSDTCESVSTNATRTQTSLKIAPPKKRPGLEKSGTAPQSVLTKTSLKKMVNSPNARTERLKLARMLQSKMEKKSISSASPRSNLNLEGLYSNSERPSLQMDISLGDDAPVIKLEELSADVRTQILDLISDDMDLSSLRSCHSEPDILQVSTFDADVDLSAGQNSGQRTVDLLSPDPNSDDPIILDESSIRSPAKNNHSHSSVHSDVSKSVSIPQTIYGSSVVSRSLSPTLLSGPVTSRSKASPSHYQQNDKENDGVIDIDISSPQAGHHLEGNHQSRLSKDNIMDKFPTIMSTFSQGQEIAITKSKTTSKPLSTSLSSGTFGSENSSGALQSPEQQKNAENNFSSSLGSIDMTHNSEVALGVSSLSHTNKNDTSEAWTRTSSSTGPHAVPADDERSISSSATNDSSQTMSELLVLSEREEEIRQEKTNMDLRLSRLNRLLEQAVNQISKCTERQKQLHDEEQELIAKRLRMIREAALHQSTSSVSGVSEAQGKTTGSHPCSSEVLSSSTKADTLLSTVSNPMPPSQTSGVTGLRSLPTDLDSLRTSTADNGDEPSISKSKWLEKFSAFLPLDSLGGPNRETLSNVMSALSSTKSYDNLSDPRHMSESTQMVPEKDVSCWRKEESTSNPNTLSASSTKSAQQRLERSLSVPGTSQDQQCSHLHSTLCASAESEPKSTSAQTPIMYVGSFMSQGIAGKVNLSAPFSLGQSPLASLFTQPLHEASQRSRQNSAASSGPGESDVQPADENLGLSTDVPTRQELQFPELPSADHNHGNSSPRNEDSDISSIVSIASGTSLGEQIKRYCQHTPGASATSSDKHGQQELPVIMSGPSDTSDLRGREEEGGEHYREPSPTMDKKAIESAETLHLLERNIDSATVNSSSVMSDSKKKKRRTRQERDSGLSVRRRRWLFSSSSDDGEEKKESSAQEKDVSSLDSRTRRSINSTSDDTSDVEAIDSKAQNKKSSLTSASGSVIRVTDTTSASGTVIPVLDFAKAKRDLLKSQGIRLLERKKKTSKGLPEAKEESSRKRDASPLFLSSEVDRSDASTVVSAPNPKRKQGRNGGHTGAPKAVTDEKAIMDDDVVLISDDSSMESSGNTNSKTGGRTRRVLRSDVSKRSDSEMQESRFPSSHGPVCGLQIVQGQLYIGYLGFGIQAYDIESGSPIVGGCLQLEKFKCMCVLETDDDVSVFAGFGDRLAMRNQKESEINTYDQGTGVNCVLCVLPDLFLGLTTGEICKLKYQRQRLKQHERFICADCSILCIASGQEGWTRLLCVASTDTTITIVDADKCLPLRILAGHSKSALSIQVHNQFVYSGSGDTTVVVHNLQNTVVEHVYRDSKKMINSVFYHGGHLFAGGLDSFVRCYNTKTHKLVQVYYGADRGIIKQIYVHDDKLITGNSLGVVKVIAINLQARNVCTQKGCGLNFGLRSDLEWHESHEHLITL